jgi:hypothetical protein
VKLSKSKILWLTTTVLRYLGIVLFLRVPIDDLRFWSSHHVLGDNGTELLLIGELPNEDVAGILGIGH